MQGHYDVKLQADKPCPLGCGPSGLNRKQPTH
jgi:large subunit ribosomal protein L15e